MKRLLAVIVAAWMAVPTQAAISSAMIFETSTAGSNNYPGCFKEGASGTDFTLNAGSYTFTDLVIDGTTNTKVTSASHNFVAADVGNCMRIRSGTGFTTGVFEIVSVASNAATLDRSAGTLSSTGGTYNVGGQLLTLAQLNTDMCAGCRGYVHADGTYSITAKVTFNYTNSSSVSWVAGYTTTRGDGGRFTVQAGSNFGDRMIDTNIGGAFTLKNVTFDPNSNNTVACFRLLAQQNQAENIECKNQTTSTAAITLANQRNTCRMCWVHDSTIAGDVIQMSSSNVGNLCEVCVVQNVAGTAAVGFNIAEGTCLYCVVDTLSGTTADAFKITDSGPVLVNHWVVYNVTRDSFRVTVINNSLIVIENGIADTAVTVINNQSGTTLRAGDLYNDYNFYVNMSGTAYTNVTAGSHGAALTVRPFVAVASHDFRLNNTTGGGAAIRAKGWPSTMPALSGTFYPDAGIAQHQDPKFFGLF